MPLQVLRPVSLRGLGAVTRPCPEIPALRSLRVSPSVSRAELMFRHHLRPTPVAVAMPARKLRWDPTPSAKAPACASSLASVPRPPVSRTPGAFEVLFKVASQLTQFGTFYTWFQILQLPVGRRLGKIGKDGERAVSSPPFRRFTCHRPCSGWCSRIRALHPNRSS